MNLKPYKKFTYPRSIKYVDWILETWRLEDRDLDGNIIVDHNRQKVISIRKDEDLSNATRSVWEINVIHEQIPWGYPPEAYHPDRNFEESAVWIISEIGHDEVGIIAYTYLKIQPYDHENGPDKNAIRLFETERKQLVMCLGPVILDVLIKDWFEAQTDIDTKKLPKKPNIGAPKSEWFEYYNLMQEANQNYSRHDLANDMGLTYGYVRKLLWKYNLLDFRQNLTNRKNCV